MNEEALLKELRNTLAKEAIVPGRVQQELIHMREALLTLQTDIDSLQKLTGAAGGSGLGSRVSVLETRVSTLAHNMERWTKIIAQILVWGLLAIVTATAAAVWITRLPSP